MLDIFSEIKKITDKYKINTQKYLKDQLEKVMEEIFEKAAHCFNNAKIKIFFKNTLTKGYGLSK